MRGAERRDAADDWPGVQRHQEETGFLRVGSGMQHILLNPQSHDCWEGSWKGKTQLAKRACFLRPQARTLQRKPQPQHWEKPPHFSQNSRVQTERNEKHQNHLRSKNFPRHKEKQTKPQVLNCLKPEHPDRTFFPESSHNAHPWPAIHTQTVVNVLQAVQGETQFKINLKIV